VVAAVAAGVEVAIATRAAVAKADAFAAGEFDRGSAGAAVHGCDRAPASRALSRDLGIGVLG